MDGRYYREVLLKEQMLPVMPRIAGDTFVFQQDSAPAHRARDQGRINKCGGPVRKNVWGPPPPPLYRRVEDRK